MLIASNFILNRSKKPNSYTLYPWVHQYVNNLRAADQMIYVYAAAVSKTLRDICWGNMYDRPRSFVAHDGFVRGITYNVIGDRFFTIGDDKTIKVWKSEAPDIGEDEEPVNTILSRTVLAGITHHRKKSMFATCGEVCSIWDESRNDPLKTFKWGVDTLYTIAFNSVETSVMACCASDRSIIFYDQPEANPLRKIVMTMKSNKLAWNPMEAFNFMVANEDCNLYTFDTCQLKTPLKIHSDHVAAATDVDYSPTGKDFVSGSYDKTIRIYDVNLSHSCDIYHTKRMQHVVCVSIRDVQRTIRIDEWQRMVAALVLLPRVVSESE